MTKRKKVPPPFEYPTEPHRRVHGPRGHTAYQAYKPWLRDEFEFRCVYCLVRERWQGDGHNSFSIDHVNPKSIHADQTCNYNNLVYACIQCNRWKSVTLGLPDPCRTGMARHLKHQSGIIIGLTSAGKRAVKVLELNKDDRPRFRRDFLRPFEKQHLLDPDELDKFGYPSNLPDLSKLKPPRGNSRPAGIGMSHFARKAKKKLPPYY
jgi:hypothetical protein